MAVDNDNHHLVTADVDGVIKVWDITEYALNLQDVPITTPPGECIHQKIMLELGLQSEVEICFHELFMYTSEDNARTRSSIWDGDLFSWTLHVYIRRLC